MRDKGKPGAGGGEFLSDVKEPTTRRMLEAVLGKTLLEQLGEPKK
jgi:hypothetical protein